MDKKLMKQYFKIKHRSYNGCDGIRILCAKRISLSLCSYTMAQEEGERKKG